MVYENHAFFIWVYSCLPGKPQTKLSGVTLPMRPLAAEGYCDRQPFARKPQQNLAVHIVAARERRLSAAHIVAARERQTFLAHHAAAPPYLSPGEYLPTSHFHAHILPLMILLKSRLTVDNSTEHS
jgi:hypothetical protein